jgi:predicted transport protein
MALYKITKNNLLPVRLNDVGVERELQLLIEKNLDSIFGLQFIKTEVALNGLRIDTLAYDPESRCFVVIEYKKDRSSSVIDQGYAYLALVLNNKADFILEYNQNTQSSIGKNDIDWSATRVIFVASRYTPHQLGAINFQDLPIELWEARFYENDLLSLERRTADANAASIKTVSKSSLTTGKANPVKTEIKTYTVNDVFPPESPSRPLYDELIENIRTLDASLSEDPKKNYVGIKLGTDWRVLFYINQFKGGMRVDIARLQPKDILDPENRLQYNEKSFQHKNQHISSLFLNSSDDIEYAMSLIRQAYKKHVKEFGS